MLFKVGNSMEAFLLIIFCIFLLLVEDNWLTGFELLCLCWFGWYANFVFLYLDICLFVGFDDFG